MFNSTYSILAYLPAQCFMTTLLTSYCVYGYFFCFNGFNRFAWFNMEITKNDRCLIKTIKTENITHKCNMT